MSRWSVANACPKICNSVAVLAALAGCPIAAAEVIGYAPDDADIANPERGFYREVSSDSADPRLLSDTSTLARLQEDNLTLVRRLYELTTFKAGPIDQSFLNHIEQDLQYARANGFKLNIRFGYTFDSDSDPDADLTDAPLSVIEQHINQLQPLLTTYADMITFMDAGFIGRWGEWHSSSNGNANVEGWTQVLTWLLAALPSERMVVVRTPWQKQQIFADQQPLPPVQAFSGTMRARTGHLNDCFLASNSDFGTYQGDAADIAEQKAYLSDENRYLPMSGETCNPNPPRSDCPTALVELSQMRWSALSILYRPEVLQSWRDDGCFEQIKRRLGYRLELIEARLPAAAFSGESIPVAIDLRNTGFAALYNPRPVELVLRNAATEAEHRLALDADPRRWLPDDGGGHTIEQLVPLPLDLPAGDYGLLLDLPDASPELMDNPAFHVRFANLDLWEAHTGMNRLNHTITIAPGLVFCSGFESPAQC